jgi:cytoskeletal protein RodZ
MNNEIQPASFGRYLKSKRLERGMSLKIVAEQTRIGLNTLVLIENEDLGKLPEEVFAKGFIRAYAKAVGADGDEAVDRYLSDLRVFQNAEKFEADLTRTTTRFWSRLMLSLALLVGIIAGSVYLFAGPQDHIRFMREPSTEPPAEIQKEATQPAEKTAPPVAAAVSGQPASEKRLLLKVAAVKGTWMKVIIDGRDAEEYKLSAGDHLELQATEGYNILIGDAKGVQLMLNEKPYRITGKSGQVVTVQIP